jgi:hypothetical protein
MISVYQANVSPQVVVKGGATLGGNSQMISATPAKLIITQGNTQTLVVNGVYDNVLNQYWASGASITGNLYDSNGAPVQECINVPLNFVPGSIGVFQGSFGDASFQPTVGTEYTLYLDGSYGNAVLHMEILVEIRARSN